MVQWMKVWLLVGCVAASGCLEVVAEPGDLADAGDSGVGDGGLVSPQVDAGSADAGSDAGQAALDGGGEDGGVEDAGAWDAGLVDAGVADAGPVDAGVADAGADDAGVADGGALDAGGPPCSVSEPCVASDYRYEQSPDCGTYCYYDEPHNVAVNGPGQGGNPSGFGVYAPGQLVDGLRGHPDYTVNMASAWVGWLYRDASIVFRFPIARSFSALRVGLNNHATGGVYAPSEIQIQFSDDDVTFGMPWVFRRSGGTLPMVAVGTRGDVTLPVPGATGRFIRVTLVYSSTWTMVDEVEFL